MATFTEMFDSSLGLVVNTIVIILAVIAFGPVNDFLAVWLGTQPGGVLSLTMPKLLLGIFYGFLLLLELALFVSVVITPFRKTGYSNEDEVDF